MMGVKIDIKCDKCGDVYQVHRTDEIPDEVTMLMCNWCPVCDDNGLADCDYEERYYYEPLPEPFNPNQTSLPL